MANLTRNFFIALSNNDFFTKNAKKYGFRLGAEQFIAGTNINSVIKSVRKLNEHGIHATVDHLGEFVTERTVATEAKKNILLFLDNIHAEKLYCHISVKLTQLGLVIDESFCLENMEEIVRLANAYDIFVNIDMENYAYYEQTLRILQKLREKYTNVGTVLQAYLYRTEDDMEQLSDVRLRLVKGAYKEGKEIAFQSKEEIDWNFLHLIKKRLKGSAFTSIATQDHHIIEEIKKFVREENISRELFEFQMLYGFRTNLQHELKEEGYRFCTYVPFGEDWYGYFMRRLAERPQNLNLIIKDKLFTTNNKIKKQPLIFLTSALLLISLLLFRRKK